MNSEEQIDIWQNSTDYITVPPSAVGLKGRVTQYLTNGFPMSTTPAKKPRKQLRYNTANQNNKPKIGLQCESKKSPHEDLWQFFQNGWEFFNQILHAYYAFLPIYARLRNFIQLPATLTKLCHIKHEHPVHIMCAKCPPSTETHAGIFWHISKTVRNF